MLAAHVFLCDTLDSILTCMLIQIQLPDNIQGRLCHTTALFHHTSSQERLVTFGGVEGNDEPPVAKTLVMDISM